MIKTESKYLIFDVPEKVDINYFIRNIVVAILSVIYKFLLNIFRPKVNEQKKYRVSLCAIFKDEDKYLAEWIEFHRVVGIDHFYMYNNNSLDDYLNVLAPYISSGIVTLVDWPIEKGQLPAYRDCLQKYSKESKWIGFIDLDEFVIPNKHDSIYQFLSQYDMKRPVIMLYWKCFGTNGFIDRKEEDLVTQDFVVSWEKYDNIGKCFFNTNYEFDSCYRKNIPALHHRMWGRIGKIYLPPVNHEDRVVIAGRNVVKKKEFEIQINHYLVKSYNEYCGRKAKKGGGTHGVEMHDMEYFFFHEQKCCDVDFHAYKYLIKTKLAIDKMKIVEKK